jgi:hypothetical protein
MSDRRDYLAVVRSALHATEFMTRAAAVTVQANMREHRLLGMVNRDSDALVDSIAARPAPNDAMLGSVTR